MQRVLFMMLLLALLGAMVWLTGCPNKSQQTGSGSSSGNRTAGAGDGMTQMSEFREEHKYTFQLTRVFQNIMRLEATDKKVALTPAQAQKILAVLQPLRKQPTLTQDEAKDAIRGLQATLTPEQREAISSMRPDPNAREGRPGSGGQQAGGERPRGQGGMGGPGGQGGPRGNRPRFDPDAMQDFNPFNPPANSPMARDGDRMKAAFAKLEARAQGK